MPKCKGCQAEIIWIKTVNGKNMPCNAEKTTIVTEGGVGFVGLLQLVFIVLKLCNVITWSWWAVLLPTIISVGLVVVILAIMLFIVLLPFGKKH